MSVRARAPSSVELVLVGRHGGTRRVVIDDSLLRDRHGQPYAVGVVARSASADTSPQSSALRDRRGHALAESEVEGVCLAGADLRIVFVSPSAARLLGYAESELLDVPAASLYHPEDVARIQPLLDRVLVAPRHTERFTARMRDDEGAWRWVEQSATNRLADPDFRAVVLELRDLAPVIEGRQEVVRTEQLHRAIVETAQEGILVVAEDGTTVLANRKLAALLELPLTALYGRPIRGMLARTASDQETSIDEVDRYETVYATPGHQLRFLSVTRSALTGPGSGQPMGALYMVSDVTDARDAQESLRRQALHDHLTGLPNRALLHDRLRMAHARHRRAETPSTAMLYIDLDGFKAINDEFGHAGGDRILSDVAARLMQGIRSTDTVARVGGDEFVVLCEDTGELGARLVAERIHDALGRPIVLEQGEVTVSGSIGIAVSPPVPFTDLASFADEAMYRAKNNGGGHTALLPSLD